MRCKMVCTFNQPQNSGGRYLHFAPVYTGSDENREFFKSTPGGVVQFNLVNEAAASNFEVGKEYYLDFSPAQMA